MAMAMTPSANVSRRAVSEDPSRASARPCGPAAGPGGSRSAVLPLLLRIGDDLLREVRRHLLVMVEPHREQTASAGHRPEVDGVACHLRLRDLSTDPLFADAGGFHPQDPAALRVE